MTSVGINFRDRRPREFECVCEVFFLQIAGLTHASPRSLLLTATGGTPRLATMETDSPATGPSGVTRYQGFAQIEAMEEAISRTMGTLTNTYPPEPGTICEVEIRLPSGDALGTHKSNHVKLLFEITGETLHRALVRVV